MIWIADLKQGVVREKAEMEKPARYPDPQYNDLWVEQWGKYNAHIASLKTYPILPGNWVDGKEYQDSEIEIEKKVNDLSKKGDADEYDYYARLKQQPIETREEAPERILCAAIWFKDGNSHLHQPKNIETGFVVAGRRHHNCFQTVSVLLKGEVPKYTERAEQGFITTADRFVTRKEAGKIAFETGQIKEMNNCLFSEDLY